MKKDAKEETLEVKEKSITYYTKITVPLTKPKKFTCARIRKVPQIKSKTPSSQIINEQEKIQWTKITVPLIKSKEFTYRAIISAPHIENKSASIEKRTDILLIINKQKRVHHTRIAVPRLYHLNQPFDSQEDWTSDDIYNDFGLVNDEKEKDLEELINIDKEYKLKKRQVFMVDVDNNLDVNDKVNWFEKKCKINGTIQYYISNFLHENFEKISNITFEMWVNYINQKPSINLDSQKLNMNTFEQYRKLWFLSKFEMTYREFYEISYKNYKYSDYKENILKIWNLLLIYILIF